MPAKFIPVGEPAHDAERTAIRFIVDGLPDDYTVYGNPWLVDRSGAVFELDTVVVAPHAVYVVEIKSFRGKIVGNDNDLYLPNPIKSFMIEVTRLCQAWPLVESEAARRTLDYALPDFDVDPLALAGRLGADIESTAAGHLFTPPLRSGR